MSETLEPHDDGEGFYAEPDRDTLVQYTIYELPEDFPKHYVIRRWEVRKEGLVKTPYYRLGRTLEEARNHLAPGLYHCIARHPNDARTIVETWT